MVGGELLNAILILRTVASSPSRTWTAFNNDVDAVLPTSAWREHRADLAGALDESTWERLVMAYSILEIDRVRLREVNDMPPGTPLTDDVIAGLKAAMKNLDELRKKLGSQGHWPDELP
jgi:hypothetical protein